ncbi:zinc finger SWIM domain-containing protein 7-like isoform X3, partial [Leptotrombidium deliense]
MDTSFDKLRILHIFESILSSIGEQNLVNDRKVISEEHVSLLHNLFENQFLFASKLIEANSVKILRSPSGREVFQVISNERVYTCFKNSYLCNCESFR